MRRGLADYSRVHAAANSLAEPVAPERLAARWHGTFSGLVVIAAAAFSSAVGAVLMKQADKVAPFRFQAWVAVVSLAG